MLLVKRLLSIGQRALLLLGIKTRPMHSTNTPITLPQLPSLALDQHVYSPLLGNDYLSIKVGDDLVGWQMHELFMVSGDSAPATPGTDQHEVSFRRPDGSSIRCILPSPAEEEEAAPIIPSPEQQKHMVEAGMKALESMRQEGCLVHRDGWWTYEYCHMKRIRQYHVNTPEQAKAVMAKKGLSEAPRVSGDYLLGRFLPNAPGAAAIQFGRTLALRYTDGEQCITEDRGTLRRTVEVRFQCSPKRFAPHFIDVFESPVCHYIIVIGTPSLCSVPEFREWTRPVQPITCFDPTYSVAKDDSADPDKTGKRKGEGKMWLEKVEELLDGGKGNGGLALLKRALIDLIEMEIGIPLDQLASTSPQKSLFEVFTEMSERKKQSKPEEKSKKKGKVLIQFRSEATEEDASSDDSVEQKTRKKRKGRKNSSGREA